MKSVVLLAVAVCAFADVENLKGVNQPHSPSSFGGKFPLYMVISSFAVASYLSLIIFLHCTAPLLNVDSPTAIEGEYIVVFKREMKGEDCECI